MPKVLENQAMLASLGIMNLVQQQRNQRQPANKLEMRRADVASTSSAAPDAHLGARRNDARPAAVLHTGEAVPVQRLGAVGWDG